MLETISNATTMMENENTDCGTMHFPVLRYVPTFEFTDEDIHLIKSLGKEEMQDFSMLTS